MTFKFDFPIKLPRYTDDSFEEARQKHVAKHGYTITVPGLEDIINWYPISEPTATELIRYKQGDVQLLGEKRYAEIHSLMQEKRENFLRMLGSPTPEIVQNAGSILTYLDDVNDTLGTLGVICRIAAQKFPGVVGRLLGGPAFWAFSTAELVGVAMQLSTLPWKARRLQHEYHRVVRNNALSKKGRVRILKRLKRTRISKGEIIEALQTTDNVFGIGLCLGPIVGLAYDIPFGLYRHITGHPVTVTGLPAPFYWFDRIWSDTLRNMAQLWTGIPEIPDRTLGKSMVAYNMATQVMQSIPAESRNLDNISDIEDIEIHAPYPKNPSTYDVITSEVGSVENYCGWFPDGRKWINPAYVFNTFRGSIMHEVKDWFKRNKYDMESSICGQNAIEAGLNTLALAEGKDAVDWDFDASSMAMLKIFNRNYRFPPDTTQEQIDCLASHLYAYDQAGLHPPLTAIIKEAKDNCFIDFTTEVPARSSVPYSLLSEKYDSAIYRLQKWYFKTCLDYIEIKQRALRQDNLEWVEALDDIVQIKREWLHRYGWELGQVRFNLSIWSLDQQAMYSP